MKKILNGGIVFAVTILMAGLMACGTGGTGSSGGGGGSDAGSGTPGGTSATKTFSVSGYNAYAADEAPKLSCWADEVSEEGLDLTNGADVTFVWLPQTAKCSVNYGDNWSPNSQGKVCEDHTLLVDGQTITTKTGTNFTFRVELDGSITMAGETIETYDCSAPGNVLGCETTQPLNYRLVSGDTSLTPELNCDGGGYDWGVMGAFDSDTLSYEACPGAFKCNVDLDGINWLVGAGILDGWSLFLNGTELSKGTENEWGTHDFTFEIEEDGSLTQIGDTLEVDTGQIGPDPSCGDTSYQLDFTLVCTDSQLLLSPMLYCYGAGHQWDEPETFEGNTAGFQTCGGAYKCNVEFFNFTWLLMPTGVFEDCVLYAETEGSDPIELNTSTDNGGGGQDFTFTVETDGEIILTGDPLEGSTVEVEVGIDP